jgi:spermidine synthase
MIQYTPMHTVLSEGDHGRASLRHLHIGQEEASYTQMRAAITGGRDSAVAEGHYVQLKVGGYLVMSDTPMERRTNAYAVQSATGDVLIGGLGLGMIIIPMITKPEVTSITVVEKEPDVVCLVQPQLVQYLTDKYGQSVAAKLKVLVADILEWTPPKGQKWDTIYFDIWPDICLDALPEMKTLHRRFGRRKTSPNAYMASWERGRLEYESNRQKRAGGRYGWY